MAEDISYMNTEVWAQLYLAKIDCSRLREFFSLEFGIKRKFILRDMHITVYYARRPLPRLTPFIEETEIKINATDTRFMVMTPGGENPRPNIDPSKNLVGVRIHRKSTGIHDILELRQRILVYETKRVLGSRQPSNHRRNAFGSRWFQPHMVILRPGSGIENNLTKIGIPFRENIDFLTFDKFEVKIVHRENICGSFTNKDTQINEFENA